MTGQLGESIWNSRFCGVLPVWSGQSLPTKVIQGRTTGAQDLLIHIVHSFRKATVAQFAEKIQAGYDKTEHIARLCHCIAGQSPHANLCVMSKLSI